MSSLRITAGMVFKEMPRWFHRLIEGSSQTGLLERRGVMQETRATVDRRFSLVCITSIRGHGGSEVNFANVIQSALGDAAEVSCVCRQNAAIVQILADRGLAESVKIVGWPREVVLQPLSSMSRNGTFEIAESSVRTPGLGRRILNWVLPDYFWRFAGFFRDALRFRSLLLELKPDLVFVSVDGSESAAFGARLAVGASRVVTRYPLMHSDLKRFSGNDLLRRIEEWISMWSSRTVLHASKTARNRWCKRYRFPLKFTRVVYTGIRQDVPVVPMNVRERYKIAPEAFVFCVPARLHPIKGHKVLFEAIVAGGDALKNGVFLLVGDGPLQQELMKLAESLGISDQIRFLGFRNDVRSVMAGCDCAVLPSTASENLSVAVLEAMSVGLPAIVTTVGGMVEAVQDGETGFVVDLGSPEALRNALVKMIRDPAEAKRMGLAAKEDVQERFTFERMTDEYADVFRSVYAETRKVEAGSGV